MTVQLKPAAPSSARQPLTAASAAMTPKHDAAVAPTDSSISHRTKARLLFFCFRVSTGSLVPFMSLYMKHTGLDAGVIGTLQAIRPIVTMVSAPLWGGLADRTGRKKAVLLLTFVLSVVCRLSAWFFAANLRPFAIALCISSIFYAPVTSLVDSIVVSSLSEREKANFGRLRLWGELGNGVASSVTLNIINHPGGFDHMFLLHGTFSVAALMSMLYCVPAPHEGTKKIHAKRNGDWREGLRVIFGNMQLLSVFGLVVVTGFSMAVLETFCYMNIRALYAQHDMMDVAGRDISLYRACYCLGGTLTWWYSGSWNRKFGPNAVMLASVCCLPLCFFLYAGVGLDLDNMTRAGFVVAEAIRSGVFAALWNGATIRLNKLGPPHVHSLLQTMLEATYRGIGHTSGNFFGGQLVSVMGIPNAFLLVGRGLVSFLCVVGAIGYWAVPEKIS